MALKYYESSRGRMAFLKRGWGDPLLMVHGIYPGASHDEFSRNFDALAKHFTIHAIDLLGYGDSDMPRLTYTAQMYEHLLRDFVVEEIGQPAHVMASGKGCGPAAELAVFNDQLMGKLVLIDPEIDPAQTGPAQNLAGKVQQFLLGTLSTGAGIYETITTEHELRRFLFSRYSHPRRMTEDQLLKLRERATQRHAIHGFISDITGHLAVDVPRWIRYVRSEVLVIWGKDVGPSPGDVLLRPATWSKGKRIEIIEDASHWPHDEQSAKVNEIVIGFLQAEHPGAKPGQNGTA